MTDVIEAPKGEQRGVLSPFAVGGRASTTASAVAAAAPRAMSHTNLYTKEELAALRGIFSLYDRGGNGTIQLEGLRAILQKIGHDQETIGRVVQVVQENSSIESISFDNFISALEEAGEAGPVEGPDPKVIEFLRILEEYRVKCEEEGDYMEAGRANRQLELLRRQEMKRQSKAIRARQLSERQEVQLAHSAQFRDFNESWERYLEEYDQMAQMYIQQMTERHARGMHELQQTLREEATQKPPRWSKELLEWRRRQHLLARQRNYAEAQKIKKIADRLEAKERGSGNESHALHVARKEAALRSQQQAELRALLKRIDMRRKEHVQQRKEDSKRLLQRNRNVQAVLESKQSAEGTKLTSEIKKSVMLLTGGATSKKDAPSQQSGRMIIK